MLYDQRFTIAGAKKKLKEPSSPPAQLPLGFLDLKYRALHKETRNTIKDIADILKKDLK